MPTTSLPLYRPAPFDALPNPLPSGLSHHLIHGSGRAQEDRRVLERCLIPVRTPAPESAAVVGQLHDILFWRGSSRYWRVAGPVEVRMARWLYDHPCGRTDIRVRGDCTCPSPDDPVRGATWWLDGQRVYVDDDGAKEAEWDAVGSKHSLGPKPLFSSDPASLGAVRYVTSYHIDTELGLYVFAEVLAERDRQIREASARAYPYFSSLLRQGQPNAKDNV